ncbi:hypothetical protein EV182_007808, partial [Spiromyces aspiralis]
EILENRRRSGQLATDRIAHNRQLQARQDGAGYEEIQAKLDEAARRRREHLDTVVEKARRIAISGSDASAAAEVADGQSLMEELTTKMAAAEQRREALINNKIKLLRTTLSRLDPARESQESLRLAKLAEIRDRLQEAESRRNAWLEQRVEAAKHLGSSSGAGSSLANRRTAPPMDSGFVLVGEDDEVDWDEATYEERLEELETKLNAAHERRENLFNKIRETNAARSRAFKERMEERELEKIQRLDKINDRMQQAEERRQEALESR